MNASDDMITTMRDPADIAEACSRIRSALSSIRGSTTVWASEDGNLLEFASEDGTKAVCTFLNLKDTLDFSIDLPDGRSATIAHILPSDVQMDLFRRCRTAESLESLIEPMVRTASMAKRREPSGMPMDRAGLDAMCRRFSSACLTEGHTVQGIEVRWWSDQTTRITGHMADGRTVNPSPQALGAITEGWRTSVEIEVSRYDQSDLPTKSRVPDVRGIMMTICPLEGMYVEGVEPDVVTTMRWAARPPAPRPMFTVGDVPREGDADALME